METAKQLSAPYLTREIDFECRDLVICDGAGVLQGIAIGNAGCSMYELRDGERRLFRMQPAFAGSFYLGIGFNEKLILTLVGNPTCHLHLSYRPALSKI